MVRSGHTEPSLDVVEWGRRVLMVGKKREPLRRGWEQAVLRDGPVPMLLLDDDGTVVHVTGTAARAVPGFASAVGICLADLVAALDRGSLHAWLDELRVSGPERSVRIEVELASDPPRTVELQAKNLLRHPRVRCIAAVVVDTTERHRHEEALTHSALHDSLTGLANRALFLERLDQAVKTGMGVAVIMIDLDRFKVVNDTHGHGVGDELLRTVGDRLSAAAPRGSTLGRLGGDEFAIVLPRATEGVAADVADRLLAAVSEPSDTSVGHVWVTACAGISSTSRARPPLELLRRADVAMYQSKAQGSGRSTAFRPEPYEPPAARPVDMLDRLRAEKAALERLVGTDELTGIGNLRRYRQRLNQLESRSVAQGQPYSLLFCDVDSFGAFNKRYGQAAGDRALQAVAEAIVHQLRSGDEVHRRGGEELVVLLPSTDLTEAKVVAERVRKAVAAADLALSEAVESQGVTISIGIGSFDPAAPQSADSVERAADRAMRRAKEGGKDQVAS
jgi:diguanylate cyclase (GGDEF)-like protein